VTRLIRDLLSPYSGRLAIILAAMLVQTIMGLAAPWPLKVVIDDVLGNHGAPAWIAWMVPATGGDPRIALAAAAGIATVVIAAVSGVAFYVANYVTESLGQWVANDLRVRIFHRAHSLAITEILGFPQKNVCNVVACAGRLPEILEMEPEIEAFAREHDCAFMVTHGRSAWGRVGRKTGWVPVSMRFQKSLARRNGGHL